MARTIRINEDTYAELYRRINLARNKTFLEKDYTNISFDDIIKDALNKTKGELK